jgi:hypothetical protein
VPGWAPSGHVVFSSDMYVPCRAQQRSETQGSTTTQITIEACVLSPLFPRSYLTGDCGRLRRGARSASILMPPARYAVALDDAIPAVVRPQKYWNAISLALLGDSVWEYYVRRHCMFPPAGTARMRERLATLSSAESQVCSISSTSHW